jgi:signal transduction histidine kinase
MLVIGWLIGNSVHQARAHAEQLRAQAATQAVTGERLRIARELHEMVAHSTGIVALQAGAARRIIDTYRIIQEAVTNVVRHADTRACQVTVDCRADELSIEVVDAGRGHGTTTGIGYGLFGMRERVSLLHGEFSAAPRPEGGFRVAARLPVPTAARRSRPPNAIVRFREPVTSLTSCAARSAT